ncbi:uncharacterized protein VTP21DRAFT_305 [Calcarisporiella thermophila]|uniref:uncharacterized protein n=1 Tax=Calcarisporiella thermophila TaxID=911321 RepID=UPI00374496EA
MNMDLPPRRKELAVFQKSPDNHPRNDEALREINMRWAADHSGFPPRNQERSVSFSDVAFVRHYDSCSGSYSVRISIL